MVKTPKTRQSKSRASSGPTPSTKPSAETRDNPSTVAAKTRHAKTRKEAVTIDLPAENVVANKASDKTATTKPKTGATDTKSENFGRSASKSSESNDHNAAPKPSSSKSAPIVTNTPKSGGIGFIGSAIVGGVVALMGAWGLQYAGLITLGDDNSSTSLAVLQSDNDALAKSLQSLSDEVKTLKTESEQFVTEPQMAAAIGAQRTSDQTPDLASFTTLQKQVSDIGTRIGEMSAALSSSDSVGDDNVNPNTDLTVLESKIATLSATISALPSSAISVEEVATIEAQLLKLADGISTNEQSDKDLRGEIESVQAVLAEQKATIEAVAHKAAEGGSQKVAATLALKALKNDVNRGLPFTQSLQQFRSITSADILPELTESADGGIPTSSRLSEDFRSLSRAIIQSGASDESTGAVARLIASAKSFANIKPLEPIEGGSLDALVSQIEFALKSKDLQSAHTHWSKLPENAKAVSNDWHTRLQARIDTERLLSRPIQDYL